MNTYQITFLPDNKKITVEKGITLLDAAQQAGIYISSVCGGEGVCGKCRVILKKGRVESESTGPLHDDEIAKGAVLACQAKVVEDVEVEIPQESRIEEIEVLLAPQYRIDIPDKETSRLSRFTDHTGGRFRLPPEASLLKGDLA